MKGHYTLKSKDHRPKYSKTVKCNHPLFSAYTVYSKGDLGIGVIQQKFNEKLKCSWWGPVDVALANDIFESENFSEWFNRNAKLPNEDGMYIVMEVRKLMYALGMKPLKKEFWETSIGSQKLHGL